MHDFLLVATAAAYLAATAVLYLSVLRSAPGKRNLAMGLTFIGVILHMAAQYHHWFGAGRVEEITILNVLSLCALVTVGLLVFSVAIRKPLFDAGLVALPIACIVLLGEWLLAAPGTLPDAAGGAAPAHILSSVMAFGVLSIAAVYALFAALIDHFLRTHHLNTLIRTLPPLEVLEGLLFQLIAAGFVLLSVSLGTGLIFVNDLFAQHLAHKTILAMAAWLIFGVLLWGRLVRGWRGRLAVRLTLAGVAFLLLSYFGSKLVLEVLLHRSWQA